MLLLSQDAKKHPTVLQWSSLPKTKPQAKKQSHPLTAGNKSTCPSVGAPASSQAEESCGKVTKSMDTYLLLINIPKW